MRERLIRKWAIALGQAINVSTWKNYGSALNSYLSFVCMHDMPVEPTAETLSLYTVYMCHHIKPNSVDTYLLGICHQLKPYFLNVQEIRKAQLVHRTLQDCKQLWGSPTVWKCALTIADLNMVCNSYCDNHTYNKMHLGKLTWLDDMELCDPWKLTKCNSVDFPLSSPLWLNKRGAVPTRSFFMWRLHHFFSSDVGGQSMRARGATSLAENRVVLHIIQRIGRWASAAWQIYICKHSVLLQAILYAWQSRTPLEIFFFLVVFVFSLLTSDTLSLSFMYLIWQWNWYHVPSEPN